MIISYHFFTKCISHISAAKHPCFWLIFFERDLYVSVLLRRIFCQFIFRAVSKKENIPYINDLINCIIFVALPWIPYKRNQKNFKFDSVNYFMLLISRSCIIFDILLDAFPNKTRFARVPHSRGEGVVKVPYISI